MNRREALSAIGRCIFGSVAGLLVGEHLMASPKLKCAPLISGPLWWMNPAESAKWGISGWRDELDHQRRIGFDLLWLTNAPSALAHQDNPLDKLMNLCAKRKVKVILDTGSTGKWYLKSDLKDELEFCTKNVRQIGERFAGHPAFYAWYIPHEIYMCWGKFAELIESFYSKLTESCKRAANLPVTLSPFFILDREKVFGDFRYNEPDEYRQYWTKLIKRSGIDVIMLQDSGEHFSYVTNDQRRPFFEAMYNACRDSNARFWGNVETAEYVCQSKEEYIRLYGRVHHSEAKGLPWRPVPIERLKEKLMLAAEYSERIVTWGYREFCRPVLGPEAKKWYDDYRSYVVSLVKKTASQI